VRRVVIPSALLSPFSRRVFPKPKLGYFGYAQNLPFIYLGQMDTDSAAESYQATAARFIFSELDTAITLCEVAVATRDDASADRNVRNAARALDAALRLEKRVRFTKAERVEVSDITSRLHSLLIQMRRQRDPVLARPQPACPRQAVS
jgi:hypothetical protein